MITSKVGVSLQARTSKWKAAWTRAPRKPRDERILRILADGAEICHGIYAFASEGPKSEKHHQEVRDLLSLWLDVAHMMEPLLIDADAEMRSAQVTRDFARSVARSRTTMLHVAGIQARQAGVRPATTTVRNGREVIGNAKKSRRTVRS